MTDLVVITPSRGRPQQFYELATTIHASTAGRVETLGLVDFDDPHRAMYEGMPLRVWTGARRSLAEWTNRAGRMLLTRDDQPRYLASLGDDHRPRTPDWDLKLIEAIEQLDGPGFAYGNDLLQGKAMPTAWVASAEVVRALGWMMLPGCQHMYVDNAILALGEAAGRIAYRPDVVIEHLHPLAGKADWDQSYRETNTDERYAADRAAFEAWRLQQMFSDARRVAALRHESRVMQ